jgi:hypothetical protein
VILEEKVCDSGDLYLAGKDCFCAYCDSSSSSCAVLDCYELEALSTMYCLLPATSENNKDGTFEISLRESTLRLSRIIVCKGMPSTDLLAICAISARSWQQAVGDGGELIVSEINM